MPRWLLAGAALLVLGCVDGGRSLEANRDGPLHVTCRGAGTATTMVGSRSADEQRVVVRDVRTDAGRGSRCQEL